ncbi:MAG: DUF2723 domain-containing protein [Anaerolineae bacterium]|nr:MAG: DUF2723 domain-containing protein [Anaerolineae bacterium]
MKETTIPNEAPEPDRIDFVIALAVGVCALAAYGRTLAPDVLYGDSAEFQTLAYTLGTTHSTGYPVYLLLARLLGFLPVGSLAWRVNLLSAVGAAIAVSGVFLLTRYLTRSRIGALLGSVALGLSYTFWSQAIIAEVYTPALAFLSLIVLLLWCWHRAPTRHNRAFLFAALLVGLGLGVHAFVVLIVPMAIALAIWTLWSQRLPWPQWRRALRAALAGLALGAGIFLLASLSIDLNDPPSSFVRVALYPSRSLWALETTDLDSPFERLWVTVTGLQWQDAMFPERIDAVDEFVTYCGRSIGYEFSVLMLLCALLGVTVILHTLPQLGVSWLIALATILFLILNYQPPDKYIFYLPAHLLVAVAIGSGAGSLLEWAHLVAVRKRRYLVPLYLLAVGLLVLMVVRPFGASRWQALRAGAATFVKEDYVYPLRSPEEPRRKTSWQLRSLPDNALLIMEWRALYTMYYLTHVERLRPDVTILEASPHGAEEGTVADTLIQTLKDGLRDGRPVFADRVYGNLWDHFRVLPALGGEWYRLSLSGTD